MDNPRDRRRERRQAAWFAWEAGGVCSQVGPSDIVLELDAATSGLSVELASCASWLFAAESREDGLAVLDETLGAVGPPNVTFGPEAVMREWATVPDVVVAAEWSPAPDPPSDRKAQSDDLSALLASAARLAVVTGGGPGIDGSASDTAAARSPLPLAGYHLGPLLAQLSDRGIEARVLRSSGTSDLPPRDEPARGTSTHDTSIHDERWIVAIPIPAPRRDARDATTHAETTSR